MAMFPSKEGIMPMLSMHMYTYYFSVRWRNGNANAWCELALMPEMLWYIFGTVVQ